jgi:hypothetical protein
LTMVALVVVLVVALAVPAFAQDYDYSYVCDDMRNSFFVDGGINLTAADRGPTKHKWAVRGGYGKRMQLSAVR